jgi:hypothetical protein
LAATASSAAATTGIAGFLLAGHEGKGFCPWNRFTLRGV